MNLHLKMIARFLCQKAYYSFLLISKFHFRGEVRQLTVSSDDTGEATFVTHRFSPQDSPVVLFSFNYGKNKHVLFCRFSIVILVGCRSEYNLAYHD